MYKKLRYGTSGNILVKFIILIAILVVCGALLFTIFNFGTGAKKQETAIQFQKGMGYCTWSKNGYSTEKSDKSIARVKEIGANWISVLTTWYQTDAWSVDIHRTDRTPTDESVIQAIRKAHEVGLKVMLKLHVDLLDTSDGSWRGEIACGKEELWDEWFKKYNDYIMHYIKIANDENVEMICIGTELSTCATVKGYMWEDLIKKIRKKYSGSLTYAAHWDRYQDIRFWGLLDYVGINAYFPLTEKDLPTIAEMKQGWQKWVEEITVFQEKTQKPVIFPEAGCSSADGAAIRPWEHLPNTEVNLKLQENYYTAIFDVFWDKEWFYGLYWWYWGTNVRMGGKYNRRFTPQNKPSEKVIEKWYAKKVKR